MSTELLPNIRSRFCDGNNVPLAGGKLYTYQAGTTTPQATYVDQAAASPNTNPIILDANGEAVIFITSGLQYKFILTDSSDVQRWSQDNISGVGFSGNIGTGDVVGPTGAVNNEIALYSGTTGKVIKRAIGTGYVKSTAGVVSYVTTISLTSEVTGALPVANGGTGATTPSTGLNALLPAQPGNATKYLQTDGTNSGWASAGDVAGQASSVDSEIALFSGTGGKTIKRATGTGYVKVTAGVMGTPSATIPIADGGTGQTTKTAAFDALSPNTTKGDIEAHNGTNNVRVPVGPDGQFLMADAASAAGMKWTASPSAGAPVITGTRAAPSNITAVGGIAFTGTAYNNIWFIQGNAGPISVTANPQIAVGTNVGQRLLLIQRSATNTLTFTDGTGLNLKGGPLVLDALDQQADFMWDGTNWVYLP